MSRHGPRYHAEIIDCPVTLEPSGNHTLSVETSNGIMIAEYDTGQVLQLEAAIAQFRSLTIQADGGRDFHNRRVVPVEVSRS